MLGRCLLATASLHGVVGTRMPAQFDENYLQKKMRRTTKMGFPVATTARRL
jgi:hypothetical protein